MPPHIWTTCPCGECIVLRTVYNIKVQKFTKLQYIHKFNYRIHANNMEGLNHYFMDLALIIPDPQRVCIIKQKYLKNILNVTYRKIAIDDMIVFNSV